MSPRRPSAPALVSALPAHQPIAVQRRTSCTGSARPSGEVVHDHAGLALYLSGTTQLWMRHEHRLVRGDLLLVPEGMPHCASGSPGGELVGVALCAACIRSAWGERLREAYGEVRRGGIAVRRLSEDALAEVERLLATLERELARGPRDELMIDGLMSQLVAHVERAAPARASAPAGASWPPVVAAALDYLEKNAARAISLKDVARAVGRSPAHLAVLLRRHTGRTAVEWITHARMALARQLLLSSDEGVEAVAARVGFASPSHFHRTFRRLHGVAPGEWRQAHRG